MSISFGQPLGSRIDLSGVEGYYLDMRVKASVPIWPPPELEPVEQCLFMVIAQWGLAAHEHWLTSRDASWLRAARAAGEHLLERQEEDGRWLHQRPYPHTFRLDPPWPSAMAQGEGASLLVRLHRQTGDERYAAGAHAAMLAYGRDSREGGVRTPLGRGYFYEEYPTSPPSLVLNGAVFALLGARDVGVGLGDSEALRIFEAGVDTLADNIGRWDTGWWSLYDLHPHPARNVASLAYHELHMDQLRVLLMLSPRPALETTLERFSAYSRSRISRSRALLAKAVFRVRVPRRRG